MDRRADFTPPFPRRPLQRNWLSRNWFQLFISLLSVYVLLSKDVSIAFDLNSVGEIAAASARQFTTPEGKEEEAPSIVRPASLFNTALPDVKPAAEKNVSKESSKFRNLSFILNPTYARRKNIPTSIVKEKRTNCQAYIDRFATVAQAEMMKYGIPASITLAQGLLESDAGDSRLAQESNNHFGIKCRSKCRGCTCRNYSDDDIYDMFRVFESAWKSFREHSELLNGQRYRHLLRLDPSDYEGWAHGLKKAGYATDKRYAQKLIQIIEELNLTQYDR